MHTSIHSNFNIANSFYFVAFFAPLYSVSVISMYSITTSPTQQTLSDLLVTPASNSSYQRSTLSLNTPTQTPSPTMSPVTSHISVPLNQSIVMHCCIMHSYMAYSYTQAASQFKRNSNHTLTKVWTLMTSLLVTILRYFYIGQL